MQLASTAQAALHTHPFTRNDCFHLPSLQDAGTLTVRDSLFTGSIGPLRYDYPTLLQAFDSGVLNVEGCTMIGNAASPSYLDGADEGFEVSCYSSSRCRVVNSISWDGNFNDPIDRMYTYSRATITVSHSDVFGGGWAGSNGNIAADPQVRGKRPACCLSLPCDRGG
jgi:hypothetical protein